MDMIHCINNLKKNVYFGTSYHSIDPLSRIKCHAFDELYVCT